MLLLLCFHAGPSRARSILIVAIQLWDGGFDSISISFFLNYFEEKFRVFFLDLEYLVCFLSEEI